MMSASFDELIDGYEDEFAPRVSDLQPFLDDEVRQRKLDWALKDYADAEQSGNTQTLNQAANDLRATLKGLEETVQQPKPELATWPERDGNRLWNDKEREDLAVPVEAIRATTAGKCVIPYQRVTMLYGTYGIGKSWIATNIILPAEATGGRVVYRLCDEGNPIGITDFQDRLDALERDPKNDSIRVIADDMFDEDDLRNEIKLAIKWLLAADNPKHSIFVIDSIMFAGGALNDQNEFVEWFKTEVQKLMDAGISVLIIAHEGKTEPEKGPLGTTASPAKVHLVLRAHCKEGQTPWTPETGGELTITVIKDRVGATRIGRYKDCAIIAGTPHNKKLALIWNPPGSQAQETIPPQSDSEQTDYAQLLYGFLLRQGGEFWGFKDLLAQGPINGAPTLRKAIKQLEADNVLKVTKPRTGKVHYLIVG